ncbi:hypothetical protein PR048_032784 [Dryococelus australis]|uniref:CHK kinase-like domain-containing protein n=1 Tax=Dryococelus australis TaxID=614101 RepID=A0ABQ9G655_9NEOP|nr:hypothetical protein PR048_032784 [Dryococelus australis]
MSSVASIPDWLDKQFIEQVLREGEKNDSIQLKHINVRPAALPGDGLCSVIFRITADYYTNKGSDGTICTKSVIVKALPETGSVRDFLAENEAFSTETEILCRSIPAFHRLLNTSTSERRVCLAPKCYYHADKPHQKLVMEDLCQSGFKMVESTLPLDLDHSKLAISHLGMFHAASVALHRQDPHSLDNFLLYPHLKSGDSTTKFLQHRLDNIAENLHESHRKYSEKLCHLGETAFHRLEKVVQRDNDGFNVLNHGDARKNNMMFRYDEDGHVSDVIFVDFQYAYYGSPAIDLLYFLYSSPSSEVRNNHYEELLECYHSSLLKTLNKLGCGEQCPSLDEIRVDIEKKGFMGVFSAVLVLPTNFVDSEHIPDLDAMLDEQGKKDSDSHMTEGYFKEIINILPIFDEKCLLD